MHTNVCIMQERNSSNKTWQNYIKDKKNRVNFR